MTNLGAGAESALGGGDEGGPGESHLDKEQENHPPAITSLPSTVGHGEVARSALLTPAWMLPTSKAPA